MARFIKNSTQKLTSEVIAEICNAIEAGAYIETAAALVGISQNSFYRWLKLGK
jgi:transposase-like protein